MVSVGTGIVFIVLVAIWLAYFVQYWSRRREHLATARSVEAFSEAMRVLERRPSPRLAGGDRISTAYAVSPARVLARPAPRPQVMAKPRPAPATPGGDSGMRLNLSAPKSASSLAGSARATLGRAASAIPGRHSAAGGPASGRPAKSGAPMPSRKVRGLALLVSLLATVVLTALAAFSVVMWWVPIAALCVTLASFLWLRSAVQAEIRARRAARGRRRRPRRAASRPQSATLEEHDAPATHAGGELIEDSTVIAAHTAVEFSAVDPTGIAADDTSDGIIEGRPDGWQPVPVPPPTYTLKAKAERPAPVYAADDDIPQAPQFDGTASSSVVEPGDSDSERRAAYGT